MWQLPPLSPEEIIIYLRKSRADDPLLTVAEVLARHEQRLDEWVERKLPGMGRIPEENRYREVVSAETLENRPRIQEVIRRMESQDVKAVLCFDEARLSRGDLEDIGRLVKLFRYSSTYFLTVDYAYDLREERDREDFERKMQQGAFFLSYQKNILNNGRLLSVQNGNFIGQHAPYGYKKITVGEGKNRYFTLEPIPDEAEAVRIMFRQYKDGVGASRIADLMHDLGYHPRKGGRWAENTIRGILKNEHYIGLVRWNHKPTRKIVVDGEIVSKRSINADYLLFPGKQPAIIDQETWDAVQARFGRVPKNNKIGNLANPFAGILYCSCGKALRRHTYVYKGVERAEPRYQCTRQKHCENASCLASELIAEVRKVLLDALGDFEIRVDATEDDSAEMQRQLVAQLEDRLERLTARELSQWDKYTREEMPKEIFDALNRRLLEEKEEVQQALSVARDAVPVPIDYEERIVTFRACLDMLDNPDAPVKELNELLRACIERITYSRPKAPGKKSRYATGNPFELDIRLRI